MNWAESEAIARSCHWLSLSSDPNAAGFYRKIGAEQIGEVESTVWPGRMIPVFRKRLAEPRSMADGEAQRPTMIDPDRVRLQPATPDLAEYLTALSYRSRQSHGYDDAFMAALVGHEGIGAEQIARDQVMLAVANDHILGYAHLMADDRPDTILLENLYIEPFAQGQGVGRRLFAWALATTSAQGFKWLEWESDPNATGFYLRMGGEKIGETESPIQAGRLIPRFRIAANPAAAPSGPARAGQEAG